MCQILKIRKKKKSKKKKYQVTVFFSTFLFDCKTQLLSFFSLSLFFSFDHMVLACFCCSFFQLLVFLWFLKKLLDIWLLIFYFFSKNSFSICLFSVALIHSMLALVLTFFFLRDCSFFFIIITC